MVHRVPHIDSSSLSRLISPEFVGLGQKHVEALIEAQKEFLAVFEQANQVWLRHAQVEAELGSELATKLRAAGSIFDGLKVCQDWMDRRMKVLAEEGQELLADGQKFMKAATMAFSKGLGGMSS